MLLKKVARYLKMFCVYITALEVLLPLPTISCFVSFFSFIFNHLLMAFWIHRIDSFMAFVEVGGHSMSSVLSYQSSQKDMWLILTTHTLLTTPAPHPHCTCSSFSLHLFLLLTAPVPTPHCTCHSSLPLLLFTAFASVPFHNWCFSVHGHLRKPQT